MRKSDYYQSNIYPFLKVKDQQSDIIMDKELHKNTGCPDYSFSILNLTPKELILAYNAQGRVVFNQDRKH